MRNVIDALLVIKASVKQSEDPWFDQIIQPNLCTCAVINSNKSH